MREQEALMEDYSDVLGQLHAKRALIIAAAGMHNILLIHKSVKFHGQRIFSNRAALGNSIRSHRVP